MPLSYYYICHNVVVNVENCCPACFQTIVNRFDTLISTTDCFIYPISAIGSRRVWPVNSGCLLLLSTWSHIWYIHAVRVCHALIFIPFFSSPMLKAQVSFFGRLPSIVVRPFVCPSVNFSHFHLLQNNWADFNQTLAQSILGSSGFKFVQIPRKGPRIFQGEIITK